MFLYLLALQIPRLWSIMKALGDEVCESYIIIEMWFFQSISFLCKSKIYLNFITQRNDASLNLGTITQLMMVSSIAASLSRLLISLVSFSKKHSCSSRKIVSAELQFLADLIFQNAKVCTKHLHASPVYPLLDWRVFSTYLYELLLRSPNNKKVQIASSLSSQKISSFINALF